MFCQCGEFRHIVQIQALILVISHKKGTVIQTVPLDESEISLRLRPRHHNQSLRELL